MAVRIETFGRLRAFRSEGEITRLEGLRLRAAVLVYLAVERTATRDSLISFFWPESDEAHARQALRQNLYELRKLLGPGWVEAGARELRVADSLTTDFGDLQAAVDLGEWAEAAHTFGGAFLDGVHLVDSASWESWVDARRAHTARLFRKACRNWAAQSKATGNILGAVEAAEIWVGRDPFDDEGQHALIESLAEARRKTEALRQYESYVALLAPDGLEPLDETRILVERLSQSANVAADPDRYPTHRGHRPKAKAHAERQLAESAPLLERTAEERVVPVNVDSHVDFRPFRRRRLRTIVGLAIVVVASAVTVHVGNLVRDPSAGPTGPAGEANWLAVLPFEYRGSDQQAHLADAVMMLLSKTLDTGTSFRTIDPRAVLGALGSGMPVTLHAGHTVARGLRADDFLVGEIVEAGGRVHVTARLHSSADSAADPLSASVQGVPDSLFGLVDELTAQLLLGRHEAGGARVVRTAALTTDSLRAFVAFLEGEQLYRGLNGRYGRGPAYDAFLRAVEIDSTFALAWYRLSQLAYFSGAALSRVVDYADAAARHSFDLPWREQRLLKAHQLYARGAAIDAERTYREILRTYPDDVEAWFGLTLLSDYNFLLGDGFSVHHEAALKVLQYEPEHFIARWSTVWSAASGRNWTQADSLLRLMWGEDAIPWQWQAVLTFGARDAASESKFLGSIQNRPTAALIATMRWVDWFAQNPAAAREFATLIEGRDEPPPVKALALLFIAEYELAVGRLRAARDAFDKVKLLNPAWGLGDYTYHSLASNMPVARVDLKQLRDSLERWDPTEVAPMPAPIQGFGVELLFSRHDQLHEHVRLYLLGRLSARLDEYDRAFALADELERLPMPSDAGTINHDLAQSIRAHAYAEQGQTAKALAVLESTVREVPFTRRSSGWIVTLPQDRLLRGELLASAGRNGEAERWLRSVAYVPESVLAGPGHLARARLYERTFQVDKALIEYERLVELWRDADSELQPVVARAREWIRRIEPSRPDHQTPM